MAMAMLPKFPLTKNPKLEYIISFRPQLLASANLMGLKGFILTQIEYENSEGQAPGDVFVPRQEPADPAANATALQLTRDSIMRNLYKEEHGKYVQYTSMFIGVFDKAHLAIIGDRVHGTLNRSLLQMKTALDRKYDVFTPKEIRTLIKTLGDGSITINPDEPIEVYLQEIEAIFNAAAVSMSTISEVDKIEYVTNELKKLSIAELNLWIMSYENTHATIISKDYAVFAASLQVMYETINRDTMRSAGYTAQAKETQNQELMAQVQELTKKVQTMEKQQVARESRFQNPKGPSDGGADNSNNSKRERGHGKNRHQKKAKGGTKFCDTCDFNSTHWSNVCRWPKIDHDANRMAP
jgi:hypothetical protein